MFLIDATLSSQFPLTPIHFSRTRTITSASPNQDTISKNLYFLRNFENMPLKNVHASDIANGNIGSIVKLVWELFYYSTANQIDPEGMLL